MSGVRAIISISLNMHIRNGAQSTAIKRQSYHYSSWNIHTFITKNDIKTFTIYSSIFFINHEQHSITIPNCLIIINIGDLIWYTTQFRCNKNYKKNCVCNLNQIIHLYNMWRHLSVSLWLYDTYVFKTSTIICFNVLFNIQVFTYNSRPQN